MPDELNAKVGIAKISIEQVHALVQEGEMASVIEVILKDQHGHVVEHSIRKSESFVRQFLDLLRNQMLGTNALESNFTKDLTGGYASIWQHFTNMNALATIGQSDRGIIVGTDATAPTIDDYKLIAQIAHGTGAGQLQYSAVAIGAVASDTTAAHFTITRDFANASGNPITVNEIGLTLTTFGGDTGYVNNHLCIRDVIAGGLVVPDGQTLTINYRVICAI